MPCGHAVLRAAPGVAVRPYCVVHVTQVVQQYCGRVRRLAAARQLLDHVRSQSLCVDDTRKNNMRKLERRVCGECVWRVCVASVCVCVCVCVCV